MKNMNKPLTFEYQDILKGMPNGYRAVALNAPIKYFAPYTKLVNGIPMKCYNAMTTKDCRHIDGCVYFAKGKVSDKELVRMIELFQKVLKEKGWKKNDGAGLTDEQQSEMKESL